MYSVYRLKGEYGQLGYGNTNHIGNALGEMGDNLNDIELGPSFSAVYIDCGGWFSCAVSATAGVFDICSVIVSLFTLCPFI